MAWNTVRQALWRSLSRPLVIGLLFISMVAIAISCTPPQLSSSQPPLAQVSPGTADRNPSSPSRDLSVGTNLSGIADWSTQLPFLDAMKFSRAWITQCVAGEPDCRGQWSTDEPDKLDLDEQGWVRSLPAPADAPEFTRVSTLIFRDIEGRYPGGSYVVLYDGEGTLEYSLDARKDAAASRPGRDVITVNPSGNGILLSITATDPNGTGNYLRNIHLVPAEYEDTFATEIFNPVWLSRIEPFQTLRFMDWMDTNNSQVKEWSDRPQVEDYTYSIKGAPIEIMAALVNRLGVDAWFCMPHQASDDYIRRFADEIKTQVDPSHHIYVEFSNEVWNWSFEQAHYALEQGKTRWNQEGDVFMQWYGMRAAQMGDIWREVFADAGDRLTVVMGTQTAWQGLENSALDCPLWVAEGHTPCSDHVDAYAITGYFSGNIGRDENVAMVESWLGDREQAFQKGITQMRDGQLLPANGDNVANARSSFAYHQQVAQSRGLSLVVYEGGQHLVRPDSDRLTEYFIELNRRPEMYDLYTELLNNWKDEGGGLFMNFTDVSLPSKWGSWGVLESVDQDSSPRYDALVDFIQAHDSPPSSEATAS